MRRFLPSLLFLALLTFACGGSDEATDTTGTDMSQAATEQSEHPLQEKNDRDVLVKDDMKAMVPETLLGMQRSKLSANSMGTGGFKMATVNATYRDEDDRKKFEVTISDGLGGNIPGMGMINSMTVDQEEGSQSTQTTTIDGHKAIQVWDSKTKDGTLTVIFEQSLVVIEGEGLANPDELEDAYKKLNLRKL